MVQCSKEGLVGTAKGSPSPIRETANCAGLPKTKVGTFASVLYDKAKKNGWSVVSMKNDWKRIFAFEWGLHRVDKLCLQPATGQKLFCFYQFTQVELYFLLTHFVFRAN